MGKWLLEVSKVKSELSSRFKMKNFGQVKGMNIEVHGNYTKLHMNDFILSLLCDLGMENCLSKDLPAVQNMFDVKRAGIGPVDGEQLCDASEYRTIVGELLHAANTVRFNI